MTHSNHQAATRNHPKTTMHAATLNLSNTFQQFFDSEKSGGILLIICTAVSLLIANSSSGADYLGYWQIHVAGSVSSIG